MAQSSPIPGPFLYTGRIVLHGRPSMSFPESFSPRGSAAAAGPDAMLGGFTGQARDRPAPMEFPPTPAVQLLALRMAVGVRAPQESAAVALEREADAELGHEANLPPPVPPMVPAETALRLHELASELARPIAAPVPLTGLAGLTVPNTLVMEAEGFSLTALANQLQSRFSQADLAAGGVGDLLAAPSVSALNLVEKPPVPAARGLGTFQLVEVSSRAPGADATEPEQTLASKNIDLLENALHGDVDEDLMDVMDTRDTRDLMDFMEVPDPIALSKPAAEPVATPSLVTPLPPSPPPLPAPVPAPVPVAMPAAVPLLLTRPSHRQTEPLLAASERAVARGSATDPPHGLGLVLGGVGLILLGIYLACWLPVFWLAGQGADAWEQQKSLAAAMLYAAAALVALTLGVGSVFGRRWAPPLIHAGGWVTALTVSGVIAVLGFHLVNAEAEAPLPATANVVALLAALLLPLAGIFYYQRECVAETCAGTSPAAAWTDALPVPALMVFLAGLALAVGAVAMLCHAPTYPLGTHSLLTGISAVAAWAALAGLGVGCAFSVTVKHASALWLLLLAAVVLAITISPAAVAGGPVWEAFLVQLGRPATAGPSSAYVPLLAALLPAPLLLIFAMARRSFSLPPPP